MAHLKSLGGLVVFRMSSAAEKAKSQRKPLSASMKNFPYRKSSDFYICRFVCGARVRLIDNHCPSSRRTISPEDHERADRQQGSFRFGLRHSPSAHVNEIELLQLLYDIISGLCISRHNLGHDAMYGDKLRLVEEWKWIPGTKRGR